MTLDEYGEFISSDIDTEILAKIYDAKTYRKKGDKNTQQRGLNLFLRTTET